MRVKRFIVDGLESLCAFVDWFPWVFVSREDGVQFSRHGQLGCYWLKLGLRSALLDERWGTGCWKSESAS